MSKLSLSKRLLGSSEEKPPLPNPLQSSALEIHGASSVPNPSAPAVAPPQDCSQLSGWSDGSDSTGGSPPPQNLQNLPQQEEHEATKSNLDNDMDPFYYDEEPPILHELYDGYGTDYEDGMCYSEHEEEQEEDVDKQDDAAIDLCDSPPQVSPPQNLNLNNNTNRMENTEIEKVDHHHRRACQVCGIELTSMHYLQQIKHVRQCLSKRHLQGGTKMPQFSTTRATTNTAMASKRKILEMDIKEWLHELGFDAYLDKFIAEEIDMTLVHALHEDDLTLLGISGLLEQRKFMKAAKKVGDEIHAAKKMKRATASTAALGQKNGSNNNNTTLPLQQQKKKQQTLQELGVSSTANLAKEEGGKKNKTAVTKGVQSAEQALLLNLYPADSTTNSKYAVFAASAAPGSNVPVEESTEGRRRITTGDGDDGSRAPLPTPPLPPTTALASARVPCSVSLFTSAAHCKQVTETLEARIEKRRTEGLLADNKNEQLGRGGLTFSRVEESRALKAMKLQALKEELQTHENTVAELKQLIAGLEADLK